MMIPVTKYTEKMILEQNIAVKAWGVEVQQKLKTSAGRFTKGKTGSRVNPAPNGPLRKIYPNIKDWKEDKLKPSLRYNAKQTYGVVDRLGFTIQRHGIFVDKGVGRGYQIRGGMVVRVDGKGTGRKRLDRQPIAAPIRRTPEDWFNEVIDANTDNLANQIMTINENSVINAIRLRIN